MGAFTFRNVCPPGLAVSPANEPAGNHHRNNRASSCKKQVKQPVKALADRLQACSELLPLLVQTGFYLPLVALDLPLPLQQGRSRTFQPANGPPHVGVNRVGGISVRYHSIIPGRGAG